MEAAQEIPKENGRAPIPEYLPARMLNEFVYCPRLFFYEWVDGVFEESVDTLEGKTQHRRVDETVSSLPAPDDIEELLGIEGNTARLYFGDFGGMIKTDDNSGTQKQFAFDFSQRNRRPPRDAVNALLCLQPSGKRLHYCLLRRWI
jgi:hypothetical protein